MSMTRHTEQEWQFTAPELGAARDWIAAQPREPSERRFVSRPTAQVRDVYYDSADWMIYRAGFALRLRRAHADPPGVEPADAGPASSESEITLKSLTPPADGVARRTEISQRVTATSLEAVLAQPDGIGERIRELVGARPLGELFRASTRRERQCLLEADSELPLAEVDLDETLLEAAGGGAQTLRRVEVECLNAEPGALAAVVESLRDAARLEPVEASKFRAGLALAGLHPEASLSLGSRVVGASRPFAASLLAILRRYFTALLEQEPKVRMGSVAAVHEMRVAARHLDTLLRATRDASPAWVAQARGAIRSLIKRLGTLRDCDVQLAHLDDAMKSGTDFDREALIPLRERLSGERSRARERLLRELDAPPARAFRDSWLTELRAEPAATDAPRTAAIALDLVSRQARKLRKRADALGAKSTPDDYHRVRVTAKRLRYLLDAFEGLYGPAAREYGSALARLQDVLGRFHDAAVRDQHFTELVTRADLPPATSFAIGRLVERDSSAFERCRRKFPKAYRRLRRRRSRALLAAMRRQAEAAAAERAG